MSASHRLSAYAPIMRAHVVRDAAFASLGFVSHDRDAMAVFLENEKWIGALSERANVTAVITTRSLTAAIPDHVGLALVDEPRRAFFALHQHLARETTFYGAPTGSVIAASATVDQRAHVPDVDVRIGERVIVEPNVTLQGRVTLDDDAIIRAGVVLGGDGFQIETGADGAPRRIVHAGSVHIGRGCEIRANSCVDRALFGGVTSIGEDSTFDHLVYVAHDVSLGRRCRVGAGAVINGSVRIEDGVWIGPNATVSSAVHIGAGAQISLGSVVTRDVAPGAHVSGNFAIDHARFLEWLRSVR